MAASSASAKPAPWEVWLAYLRFADHPETGKVRPVVIVDDMAAAIVVAKVTTADPQERYKYCELADWEREGLLKPSRVQASPLFRLAPIGSPQRGAARHAHRARSEGLVSSINAKRWRDGLT